MPDRQRGDQPCARPGQAEFAAALFDSARATPCGLRAWNDSDVSVRLAVHRNNVVVSLTEALAEGFPVVRRLVGGEFFEAMAGLFVRAHPPRSPVLSEYGDGLAGWLAGFGPVASLPYLPDLARLERARVRAFHAADAPALAPGALTQRLLAPEHLAHARLRLHPSLTVIRSEWAIASLWAAHQHDDEQAIARVELDDAECALVLRDGDDVLVLPGCHADATFVQALLVGQPLGAAIAASPELDLTAALAPLIRHGAISDWRSPGDRT